jgi:hypothetical protein
LPRDLDWFRCQDRDVEWSQRRPTPYNLTLTRDERAALDWTGDASAAGAIHYLLLWLESAVEPEDADWDSADPITFTMSEHVACSVRAIVEGGLDCLSAPLVRKFQRFSAQIV